MFTVRKHTVEIYFKYGDGIIEIIYRDSKNMLYKSEDDSTRVIHKKFNARIMNLHPESSGLVFQKFHSFMHYAMQLCNFLK